MTRHDPSQPKLTVVIPAFNVAPYIDECLDSVFSQEGCQEFEVVVVDDGSTDGTGDALRRRAELETRLNVITSQNGGPGHARNLGVETARSDIIIFLDSDDRMMPGRLRHQGNFMLHQPAADVTFGDAILQGLRAPALQVWDLPAFPAEEFREIRQTLQRFLVDGCFINFSTSAVKRSLYLASGGQTQDRRMPEDMEFWCRLAGDDRRFFVTRQNYAWYRRERPGSLMSSSFGYIAPTMLLAQQLRLHAMSLPPDERAKAQRQMDWRANMYLRYLWAFERHQLDEASAELADVVSWHVIKRWHVAKLVPSSVGRGARKLKRWARDHARQGLQPRRQ